LHGIPQFAISIGLERDGQIVAGVVFNPAMDELYTAEKGGGAFVNDRRLRVAARKSLAEALFGTGTPFLGHGDHAGYLYELRQIMGETSGVRRMGAASLDMAYVAAGRLDGFWERKLKPWDVAAGSILVREAGGFISGMNGAKFDHEIGDVVCGNEFMRKALSDQIALAERKRTAAAQNG
ncbi:inositol monophosphatase family protein, partial [Aurantimonas coralicida]